MTDRELLEAARATVLRLEQEHAAWRDRVVEEAGKDKARIAELESELPLLRTQVVDLRWERDELRRGWQMQTAAWADRRDQLIAERDMLKRQYDELLEAGLEVQAERDRLRDALDAEGGL